MITKLFAYGLIQLHLLLMAQLPVTWNIPPLDSLAMRLLEGANV